MNTNPGQVDVERWHNDMIGVGGHYMCEPIELVYEAGHRLGSSWTMNPIDLIIMSLDHSGGYIWCPGITYLVHLIREDALAMHGARQIKGKWMYIVPVTRHHLSYMNLSNRCQFIVAKPVLLPVDSG